MSTPSGSTSTRQPAAGNGVRRVLGDVTPHAVNSPRWPASPRADGKRADGAPKLATAAPAPFSLFAGGAVPDSASPASKKRTCDAMEAEAQREWAASRSRHAEGARAVRRRGEDDGAPPRISVGALKALAGLSSMELVDDNELSPTEIASSDPESDPDSEEESTPQLETDDEDRWDTLAASCVADPPDAESSDRASHAGSSTSEHHASDTTDLAKFLYLRLGMAAYRVRTNQTDTPFSELALMQPSSTVTTPTAPASSSSAIGASSLGRQRFAHRARPAGARRAGSDDMTRPYVPACAAISRLLPAPNLRPMAFASGTTQDHAHAPRAPDHSDDEDQPEQPSSAQKGRDAAYGLLDLRRSG